MSALAPAYIRKIYSDEPSFKTVKIVVVLDGSEFEGSLSPEMVQKLKAEGLKDADLKLLKNKDITPEALLALTLKYAHGVIVNTPELKPEVAALLENSKAKILPYSEASKGTSEWVKFVDSML